MNKCEIKSMKMHQISIKFANWIEMSASGDINRTVGMKSIPEFNIAE